MLFRYQSFLGAEEEFRPSVISAVNNLVKPENHKDVFDVLKLIRGECHFEMNQIGTRLTWLLAAQTFLVSAAVVAVSGALRQDTRGPGWLAILAIAISVVGLAISFRSYYILYAAMWTIDLWHERLRLIVRTSRTVKAVSDAKDDPYRMDYHAFVLGRWTVAEDPVHNASLTFAKLIPGVFVIFWTLLFCAATWLACLLPLSVSHTN